MPRFQTVSKIMNDILQSINQLSTIKKTNAMRKSFTQLFSIFILICAFGFTSLAQGPGLDSLSPADGADNVDPTTTQFVVEFDTNIEFTATGGTFTITEEGILIKTIVLDANSSDASISGKKLYVTHGVTLVEGNDYTLGITDDAIEGYAGLTGWDITIGDYTDPVIGTLSPANGANNIDINTPFDLVITFDDASDIDAVDDKKVWLYKADGTIIDIITLEDGVNVATAGKTATIDLAEEFAYFDEYTTYYVHVEAGAFKDDSEEKNEFAGFMDETTWSFTTRDYSAAAVESAVVSDETVEGATVTVTISEQGSVWYKVDSGSPLPATVVGGWTQVMTDQSGVATFTITGLDDDDDYTVYLIAQNLEDDQQPAASSVSFTTLDATNPIADKRKVNDDSEGNTNRASIGFDEPVQGGSGTLELRRASDNLLIYSLDASEIGVVDSKSWIGGSKRYVVRAYWGDAGVVLESEVDYYITFPNGFVTDLSGNPYENPVASDYEVPLTSTDWTFTASDVIDPTVAVTIDESTTPPAADDDILLTFSEGMALVDGTWWSTVNGGDQDVWFEYLALELDNKAIPFTASMSGSPYDVITIDPSVALLPNTEYTIVFRPNAFEDRSDNENKLSVTEFRRTVITDDFGDADITLYPANGATDVPGDVELKVMFSKGVQMSDGDAANNSELAAAVSLTNGGAVAFSTTWDAATRTLTVTPDDALTSEGTYDFDFDESKVEDIFGEPYNAPVASNFDVMDYIVPVATLSHVGPEVTDIAADVDLTIEFDEDVTDLGGDPITDMIAKSMVVFKYDNADGMDVPATVTWAANTITINPTADLVEGKTYYYGVGASASDKPEGMNVNVAAYETFTFNPAPPAVVLHVDTYSPAIDATGVTLDGGDLVATLTFNEAIKPNPTVTFPVVGGADLYTSADALVTSADIAAIDFVGSTLTITFTPVGGLTSEGDYYITLDGNLVTSNDDNTDIFVDGIVKADGWAFTAADAVAPVISVSTPADNATDVALNAALKLTANEKVQKGTGNITISAVDGADDIVVPVADVTIDGAGTGITIPHDAFTQYGTEYDVLVPAGAFKDLVGNNANAIGADAWDFTTLANPAPYVMELDPADGEDLVDPSTDKFYITFSEDVVVGPAGTSIFLVEDVDGGTTSAVIEADGTLTPNGDNLIGAADVGFSTEVTVSGAVATVDFGVALAADKDYYILVEVDAFMDKSEPTPASTAELVAGDWDFTTKDVFAPTWEVSYTERGSGMDIASDIVITFSKPIEEADGSEIVDVNIANLFELKLNGSTIEFTGTIDAAKKVVTLSNDAFVPALTTDDSEKTISVAPAASAIRGQNNLEPVSETAETFPVSDYVAPTVDVLTVNDVSDGIKFKFNVQSSEKGTVYYVVTAGDQSGSPLTASVVKTTGTALSVNASSTKIVTVTDVTSETTYTVFAVAEDETGNLGEVEATVIETGDITKPTTILMPNAFTKEGKLTISFSEDVDPMGAMAYIRLQSSGQIVGVIDLVNGLSYQLVIDQLNDNSGYPLDFDIDDYADTDMFMIEIAGGVVEDVSANMNTWDGQIGLGDNAWIVGLPDDTAPVFTGITPASPVSLDAVFTLTFNEDVQLGSTYEFLFEYEEDGWNEFELVQAENISVINNTIVIDPDRMFWREAEDGTDQDFRLVIQDGSIEDLAGNVAAPIAAYPFVTVDDAFPTVAFNPEDGEELTTTNPGTLTISFSEAVYNPDESMIDAFDLDSLAYFSKGGSYDVDINAAGTEITFSGFGSLTKGASYTYGIKEKFIDDDGNVVPMSEATFSVAAEVDPGSDYVTFDPDNGTSSETPILVGDAIKVVFEGQLFTYSGVAAENNLAVTPAYLQDVFVFATKSGGTPIDFTVSIEKWEVDETIIVLTPDEDLASETKYKVTVLDDYLQIGTGNVLPLVVTANTVHEDYDDNDYITNDVINPEADDFYPDHESTAVKTDAFAIEFDEKVTAGTGTIEVRQWNGVLVKEIDASTLGTSTTGGYIELADDLSDLTTNLQYYVIIPEGAIVDMSGNPWEGVTTEDGWTFDLQDDVNPVATDWMPQGPNTPIDTDLTIYFDRPIALNGDDEGFIAIYDVNGIAIELFRLNDGAGAFTVSDDMVTIDISTLEEDTEYLVELAAGTVVSAVDGSLMNTGIDRALWSFTTETNDVPEMVTLSPENGATDVALDAVATITFNIDVQAGAGMIELHQAGDGAIVHSYDVATDVVFDGPMASIDLAGYITDQTSEYYIIVPDGAITNISSTPEAFPGLEQTSDWNFSTVADGTAPTLLTWTPNAETIDDNHPTFVMTFDEDVMLSELGGNLVVTRKDSVNPTLTIPFTAEMVDGATVTVTYVYDEAVGGLDKDAEYFVTVDAGALEDAAGNAFAGVADATAWTFTTGDFVTDTPELDQVSYLVYPNPFDGYVIVKNASQLSRIVISNVAGQRVKDIVNPSDRIATNEFRSGIYFITLVKDDVVVKTERIVKR